jgi:hypothetical protein
MKSATVPLGENARLDGVRVLVVDDAAYVLEMGPRSSSRAAPR